MKTLKLFISKSRKLIRNGLLVVILTTVIVSPIYAVEISNEEELGDCVPLEVRVFGIKILNKYHSGCSLSQLPDGRWDWFPKN
jgi:hypothetical protein